jgi:hypothetical protein
MNTSLKLGTHAVMVSDIISPILDSEGYPQYSLRQGDKVVVTSLEPLIVRGKENNLSAIVEPDFFKTTKGRPVKIG